MAVREFRGDIHNSWNDPLIRTADEVDGGQWQDPWYPSRVPGAGRIEPSQAGEWRSESDGILTGTSGWARWAARVVDPFAVPPEHFEWIQVNWSVPFLGEPNLTYGTSRNDPASSDPFTTVDPQPPTLEIIATAINGNDIPNDTATQVAAYFFTLPASWLVHLIPSISEIRASFVVQRRAGTQSSPLTASTLSQGIIYTVDPSNNLMWYRHDGRNDGSFRWLDNNARKVGVGWDVKHIFSGGGGIIYTVDANNNLMWYRHDGRNDGSFRWLDNNARKVGVGWDVKHIFSGGGGIIYTVDANNNLMWYRHDGWNDGSFRWLDNNARKVGAGWDVKHIFSGGDGIIYTIDSSNNLMWYRHDGRNDGSFRWFDNHPRKVGVGWDVKHVFSGGDGIIYTVDSNNNLMWYRHDGRDDGSFRWLDNNARKVGVGWDVKHIFSGR